ncbi:MAG TPA: hypothetical protein VFD01_23130 [Candidatus Dormibacteraeota bacterium]|nr:hypothetical protein [Candidatus Dormibacteraeota bacterium]
MSSQDVTPKGPEVLFAGLHDIWHRRAVDNGDANAIGLEVVGGSA